MRKTRIVLWAIFGVGMVAKAQKTETFDNREIFTIGARVGANLSNVWDSEDQDFHADPKLGFAGAFLGNSNR